MPGIIVAIILKNMKNDMNVHLYEKSYHKSHFLKEVSEKLNLNTKVFQKNIFEIKNLETGTIKTKPLELFLYLNELGSINGIGRMDMVENRFIGIKSRGIYETPGGTILNIAHKDIEGIAMDREVMRLRDMLSAKISEIIYNGFWYSPEMEFLMSAIEKSQEVIDGKVYVKLYKGNAYVTSRESSTSLYDEKLASMHIEGGFNQQDSEGFIKINAIRLMAHNAIIKSKK